MLINNYTKNENKVFFCNIDEIFKNDIKYIYANEYVLFNIC